MAANYIEPRRRFNTEYRSRVLPNQIAAFEGAGLKFYILPIFSSGQKRKKTKINEGMMEMFRETEERSEKHDIAWEEKQLKLELEMEDKQREREQ